MVRAISLLALVVLSTVSATAFADVPPIVPVTAEATAEAKTLFERGASAYRAGEYERAIALFRQADRLAPRAALSFNMARAHERLGQRALAASVPAAGRFRQLRAASKSNKTPSTMCPHEIVSDVVELVAALVWYATT